MRGKPYDVEKCEPLDQNHVYFLHDKLVELRLRQLLLFLHFLLMPDL